MRAMVLLPLLLLALAGSRLCGAEWLADAYVDADAAYDAYGDDASVESQLKAGQEADAAYDAYGLEDTGADELAPLERERRAAQEGALSPLLRVVRQSGKRKRPGNSPPPGERPPKRQRPNPTRRPTPPLSPARSDSSSSSGSSARTPSRSSSRSSSRSRSPGK